ncbi:cobalamin biosynthesis protein CobW, partial [Pseudomonas syringae pv. tagetis]
RAEVAEVLPPAVKVILARSGRVQISVLLGVCAETEAPIDGPKTHHDHHNDADHDYHDHDAIESITLKLPQADEKVLLGALNKLVVQH